MIEATRLEDTGRRGQPMEEDDGRAAPDAVSEQEMDDICCNHIHILRQLTCTTWLPRQLLPGASTVGGWDVLKPALLAYQVAADIGKKSWELLSEWNIFEGSLLSSCKKIALLCLLTHLIVTTTTSTKGELLMKDRPDGKKTALMRDHPCFKTTFSETCPFLILFSCT